MGCPIRFFVDGDRGRAVSAEEIRPYVRIAVDLYRGMSRAETCGDILPPEEIVERSLEEHNLVLIHGDYLLAYSLGEQWWSRGLLLSEEYLARVGKGRTRLKTVFNVMRQIQAAHGAREFLVGTFAPSNQGAIRRLYERCGLTEVNSIMRL